MIQILKKIPLFSELSDQKLLELEKISSISRYRKDEILFEKGEIIKHLYILIDGIAYVYKEDNNGNEIIIGYFYGYEILVEAPTLMHEHTFSTGKFKSNGKIMKINLKVFEKDFMCIPSISNGIIQSLLKKIKLLQRNIHLNINGTAKEKIIHFYEHHYTFSIDLKKYEIAALLGVTAETYSRTVKDLVEEKILVKTHANYKFIK
jgi:CRP/FNR family transcriptional regulator